MGIWDYGIVGITGIGELRIGALGIIMRHAGGLGAWAPGALVVPPAASWSCSLRCAGLRALLCAGFLLLIGYFLYLWADRMDRISL